MTKPYLYVLYKDGSCYIDLRENQDKYVGSDEVASLQLMSFLPIVGTDAKEYRERRLV